MKLEKILKHTLELGRTWLTGVREAYLYENGVKTNTVVGYKYRIVFIDMYAEVVDFKIMGEKLMDDPNGHIEVKLVDPVWVPYVMNNRINVVGRASGIQPVKK